MADLKSQVESLYSAIFHDVEALTGLDMRRDFETLKLRYAHEDLAFLTRTLPLLYKHILRSLELGIFTPINGFKHHRSGPLPLFLGGLVSMLFDSSTGKVIESSDPLYLACLAQICTLLYKCSFPYTIRQERDRLAKFKQVEKLLPDDALPEKSGIVGLTLANSIYALQEIFKDFKVDTVPKHGPGAVSGREKGEQKYAFKYTERIDQYFEYEQFFQPYRSDNYPPEWLDSCLLAEPESSAFIARGLFVPKDARGPRYISAEPKEHMWIQQMLGMAIVKHISHSRIGRHINFTDQSINGQLALSASLSRKYATLDMEDASDRVSLALVRCVFPTKLVRLLEACRSESALLPDGEVLKLRKFAPMGSACCFPVESILFFTLVAAAIQAYTGGSFQTASKGVYVFGDDIIVPHEYTDVVINVLEQLDLKFNKEKCFSNGSFRESCGVDAFAGVDITPVKVRCPPPKDSRDVSAIISWTETSNLMFFKGFWYTADYIRRVVENVLPHNLTIVPQESGCLGLHYYKDVYEVSSQSRIRWNTSLQCLQLRVRRISTPEEPWSKTCSESTLVYLARADETTNFVSLDRSLGLDRTSRTKVSLSSMQTLKYRWVNLS